MIAKIKEKIMDYFIFLWFPFGDVSPGLHPFAVQGFDDPGLGGLGFGAGLLIIVQKDYLVVIIVLTQTQFDEPIKTQAQKVHPRVDIPHRIADRLAVLGFGPSQDGDLFRAYLGDMEFRSSLLGPEKLISF